MCHLERHIRNEFIYSTITHYLKGDFVQNLIFIGDVHGRSDKLLPFIQRYGCGDTQFVFVGDLIDNALNEETDHLTTLNMIHQLCEQSRAVCIMGNHELNAIGWSLQKNDGSYCRPRNKLGNLKQHQCFLAAVGSDSAEHQRWIEWFKRLPIFVEYDHARAIHACWNQQAIDQIGPYLNSDNSLKDQFWYQAFDEQHELYHLLETLLKGPELALPKGYSFLDKTGIERAQVRVAWWKGEAEGLSYADIALLPEEARSQLPQQLIPVTVQRMCAKPEKLTVIGHYTLPVTRAPQTIGQNVVCVDFNAAKGSNPLVGYKLDVSNQLGTFVISRYSF